MSEEPKEYQQPPEVKPHALLKKLEKEFNRSIPPEYQAFKNFEFVTSGAPYSQFLKDYLFIDYTSQPKDDIFEQISFEDDHNERHRAFLPKIEELKKFIDEHPESLTEFAKLLQTKIRGGRIVDLGAGYEAAPIMQRYSAIFDAKEYIGIDRAHDSTAQQHENTTTYRLQGDNLHVVAAMPDNSVDVFHLSGLENYPDDTSAQQYCDYLIKEMTRVLKADGIVVVGQGSFGFNTTAQFEKYGLEKYVSQRSISSDNLDEATYQGQDFYWVYKKKQ